MLGLNVTGVIVGIADGFAEGPDFGPQRIVLEEAAERDGRAPSVSAADKWMPMAPAGISLWKLSTSACPPSRRQD